MTRAAANDDEPSSTGVACARDEDELRRCMAWILSELACGDAEGPGLLADLALARGRLAETAPRPRPALRVVGRP